MLCTLLVEFFFITSFVSRKVCLESLVYLAPSTKWTALSTPFRMSYIHISYFCGGAHGEDQKYKIDHRLIALVGIFFSAKPTALSKLFATLYHEALFVVVVVGLTQKYTQCIYTSGKESIYIY